jgi:phage replication-related protein YjqB (UPF0714/DUF867 family)
MANSWYKSFAEMTKVEREHLDFERKAARRWSRYAIIAPHGGGIEPGTTELVRAIAGWTHSFYTFDGIKPSGNELLHITSTLFDEPKCIALLGNADIAIAIHGCEGRDAVVQIGGLHLELGGRMMEALNAAGIKAVQADENLAGLQPENICNRARSGKGVQMELSTGLRRSMFAGLSRQDRLRSKPIFKTFANTVRAVLADYRKEARQ